MTYATTYCSLVSAAEASFQIYSTMKIVFYEQLVAPVHLSHTEGHLHGAACGYPLWQTLYHELHEVGSHHWAPELCVSGLMQPALAQVESKDCHWGVCVYKLAYP